MTKTERSCILVKEKLPKTVSVSISRGTLTVDGTDGQGGAELRDQGSEIHLLLRAGDWDDCRLE